MTIIFNQGGLKMRKKILYGLMLFISATLAFFIIGCMYGYPVMGILIGWGMVILLFCIMFPIIKLGG